MEGLSDGTNDQRMHGTGRGEPRGLVGRTNDREQAVYRKKIARDRTKELYNIKTIWHTHTPRYWFEYTNKYERTDLQRGAPRVEAIARASPRQWPLGNDGGVEWCSPLSIYPFAFGSVGVHTRMDVQKVVNQMWNWTVESLRASPCRFWQ